MNRQGATNTRQAGGEALQGKPANWRSVEEVAAVLSMSPEALRRALERRAMRAPDGGVEVSWDGVRARKLGRLWRVCLSERWMDGAAEVRSTVRGGAAQGQEAKRP